MRKGFKVLAAIMVVAMLCTMSLSAFAASHVTETTIENGVYTTETTVTTDYDGEQVAYLVYKPETEGAAPSTSNIVYIDQKAATGTTATFSFSPDAEDAGALIKVGTTSAAASAVTTTTGEITLPPALVDVTWSVSGGNGKVALAAADGVTLDYTEAKADVALGELTFVVEPEMGYKLATVNGDTASVNTNGYYVATVTAEDTNFVFTFEAVTGDASAITEETAKSISYGGENGDSEVFVLGKAAGPITNAGMYFSMARANLETLPVDGAIPNNVVRVQALKVGSDGAYAIKLKETMTSEDKIENYTQFITGSTIYACSFVKSAAGYDFGDIVEITVAP